MSNAMRFGKRTLAGVAAGALGAAMLTIVATSPATASSGDDTKAATIEWSFGSYTVIVDGQAARTKIVNALSAFDADGESMDDSVGADRKVRVSIDPPSLVTDDSAILVGDGYAAGGRYTPNSLTVNYFDDTVLGTSGLGGTFFWPGNLTGWSSVGSGNYGDYTVTADLINTATNTIISTDEFVVHVAPAAAELAPAAVLWANGTSATGNNLIDGLGQIQGGTASNIYPVLLDAGGGPFITKGSDDTLTISGTSLGTGSYSTPANGFSPTPPTGAMTVTGSGLTWSSTATLKDVTATYTTADGTESVTGTLKVSLAEFGANALQYDDSMAVTSKSYLLDTTDDSVYEVPAGSTSVTVQINLEDDSDGTIAWNTLSTGGATAVSVPSGGAVEATNGVASQTIALTADVSADGEVLYVGAQINAGTTLSASNADLEIHFVEPSGLADIPTSLGKLGSAATMAGTYTDQFGDPMSGSWQAKLVTEGADCTATAIVSTTVAADGSFTLAVPAAQSPAAAGLKSWTVCFASGFESDDATGSVYYTASGEVSSVTVSGNDGTGQEADLAVISTPATPSVALTSNNTATSADLDDIDQDTINNSDTKGIIVLTVSASPVVQSTGPAITVTAPAGIYLTKSTAASISVGSASQSVTVANGGTVKLFATKPGLHKVTATVGTVSTDWNFYVGTKSANGRVISITEVPASMKPNTFSTVKGKVVDIFGNPVPENAVTAAAAGDLTPSSTALETDEDGIFEVLVTAGDAEGTARITFTDDSTTTGTYAGYPDKVSTVYKDITISSGTASKTIVIEGERGTVLGKPGIEVEGETTGFATGDTVKPWVRFPGGEYTLGSARPAIDAAGGFSWSRKTGKKSYVYFTSDDGGTVSNRVIIPAK